MNVVIAAMVPFLSIPMLMYAAQAYTYYSGGRVGMALAMIGYTIGNIGLIMDSHGL
jgi:uncharacterized protein (DUF169 family)